MESSLFKYYHAEIFYAMGKKKHISGASGISGLVTNDGEQYMKPITTWKNQVIDDMNSPLKLFGEAKEKINGSFIKLDNSVSEAFRYFSEETKADPIIQDRFDTDRLIRLKKSIETIRSVLSRNQMKVAFFGRTSNGKSTVINAILHNRVLPMGFGHTTGCFLQIQGTQTEEAYYQVQKDNYDGDKKPLQSMAHIANALNHDALEKSSLIKIYWPVSKCPLLRYDVALVDSPGVDVEGDLDEWIDAHCHDADVFVLVSNAESTLNMAEMNFFIRVKKKLSKPNIFILNNRWDSIIEEPNAETIEKVRAQHVERGVKFLSEELEISSREEAKRRTFFVSAREALASRCPQESRGHDSFREGFEARMQEFSEFEHCFEESLSKSAVQTKFQKHNDKGIEIIKELNSMLHQTQANVAEASHDKENELKDFLKKKNNIEVRFNNEVEQKHIKQIILECKCLVQNDADKALEHEIKRLSRIVEDFCEQFPPEMQYLSEYKQKLYGHVERALSENFQNKIRRTINKDIEPCERMLADIISMLPEEGRKSVQKEINSKIRLDDELFDLTIYKCAFTGFQEDLEFRFSLGLITIVRKLQSTFSKQPPVNTSLNGSMNQSLHYRDQSNDVGTLVERLILSSPQSPTTVGSLAVGGILVRTVGLKVIVMAGVIYGALYAYEYLTWTKSAKERVFKSQYTRYAIKGLTYWRTSISENIAKTVGKNMSDALDLISHEMDNETTRVEKNISLLKSSLENLRGCDNFATQLLSQNVILMDELLAFAGVFLS